MSDVDSKDFLDTIREKHREQHEISATRSPPTTLESFPPGISVMEYFVRPQEIQSCTWRVDKYGNHSTPRDCACTNIPNHAACVDGYKAVLRETDREILANDPNSVIEWCWTNAPEKYSNQDLTTKRSWILGCLTGIRGEHQAI